MARIVFSILGKRVQDVGYRLFILSAMKERGLVGFPVNLGTGKQVNIVAWGNEKQLIDFHDFLAREKTKGVGTIFVGEKLIDNTPKPSSNDLLNEKMDLMIEQTGKFVQTGRAIQVLLQKMPKKIGEELKPILAKSSR